MKQDFQNRLAAVQSLISNADSKISIGLGIFSFIGLFMGFIFTDNFDKLLELKGLNISAFIWILVLFGISMLLFIASIIAFVAGIFPRLNPAKKGELMNGDKDVNCDEKNFWFFKHIANLENANFFVAACKKRYGDFDDNCREILEEVYANSDICLKKMYSFRVGIILSLISMLLSFACVTILIVSLCCSNYMPCHSAISFALLI